MTVANVARCMTFFQGLWKFAPSVSHPVASGQYRKITKKPATQILRGGLAFGLRVVRNWKETAEGRVTEWTGRGGAFRNDA